MRERSRPNRQERKLRPFLRFTVFTVVTVLLLFFLLEGVSSTVLFLYEILTNAAPQLAERSHTEYDSELGWVNVPNVYIKDMYGAGKHLRTNSQAFRNDRDFPIAEPHGKLRIICSGNSFTLGYGVDNEDTWCQVLAALDAHFETVNMGQGGYGIDQAYLWYRRDGTKLEHSVHIFAFIRADFLRLMSDNFLGYGKPVLRLNDDALVVDNVPVPQRAFYAPWLARNMPVVRKLRSIDLGTKLLRKVVFRRRSRPEVDERQYAKLALKVFEAVAELNRAKESILVLVHLPTSSTYSERERDDWRDSLSRELARKGLIFFDLTDNLRKLSPDEVSRMFIPEGSSAYYAGSGHCTEEGNRYVADWLYQKLLDLPELSSKLKTME